MAKISLRNFYLVQNTVDLEGLHKFLKDRDYNFFNGKLTDNTGRHKISLCSSTQGSRSIQRGFISSCSEALHDDAVDLVKKYRKEMK